MEIIDQTLAGDVEVLSGTPRRVVTVAGETDAIVPAFGVAVVGSGGLGPINAYPRPEAQAADYGAAIAGDDAVAKGGKGSIAFGGQRSEIEVSDGAVAKAGYDSFASGSLTAIAVVDDRGWALSSKEGVAVCRGGIAETRINGIACAYSRKPGDGERGIAIAGRAGIAIALDEGSLVQAGPGGALAGFWLNDTHKQLAFQLVDASAGIYPDTLYKFIGGRFHELTEAEASKAAEDILAWKGKWAANAEIMHSA